ncbi:chalcone-flavanone isomerase-domain-containing protein [Lyophyllum atratum]|nr:chalcone-flavanone isomerase-domain-containing protein [Lyophyllum atratum]
MFNLFRPFGRRVAQARGGGVFATISKRALHSILRPKSSLVSPRVLWGAAAVLSTATAFVNFGPTIYLDSAATGSNQDNAETIADPATSIEFPTTIRIPSKIKIPTMSLVGLGVRTVSFLGIKVYSVGFYADLANPNLKLSPDMSVDEKIEHIVRNTACVIRIVPMRTTSYTHLRDAFMRALQARMALGKTDGTLSEEEAYAIGSPMRKLKSLFPNSPLQKGSPLDIFLSAPSPERPRTLVFRDLGAIESDWVATEFVLHYFEGAGPSPAVSSL